MAVLRFRNRGQDRGRTPRMEWAREKRETAKKRKGTISRYRTEVRKAKEELLAGTKKVEPQSQNFREEKWLKQFEERWASVIDWLKHSDRRETAKTMLLRTLQHPTAKVTYGDQITAKRLLEKEFGLRVKIHPKQVISIALKVGNKRIPTKRYR